MAMQAFAVDGPLLCVPPISPYLPGKASGFSREPEVDLMGLPQGACYELLDAPAAQHQRGGLHIGWFRLLRWNFCQD